MFMRTHIYMALQGLQGGGAGGHFASTAWTTARTERYVITLSVTEIITQRVLWSAIFKNTQTLPQLAGLCTYHFLGAALIALVKPYLGRLYSSIPFPNMYI